MHNIHPAFTGATIDRADQLRNDPDGLTQAMMKPSARVLAMQGLDPAFDDQGELMWTSIAETSVESALLLLGLDSGKPCFVELPKEPIKSGPANPRMWQAMAMLPPDQLAIYGAARSLIDWHGRHRFCAVCGEGTKIGKGGWSRECGSCKAEHFPRVDPVAIMLAEHDGKILMGRQPAFPPKRFSALAGFIEPGESIEEGVARELWEEAGIRVRDVRYIASQPWPFPSSLMMACTSVTDDPTLTLDTTEIEEAHWFTEAEVRSAMNGESGAPFIAPPPFAIAHNLLVHWLSKRG